MTAKKLQEMFDKKIDFEDIATCFKEMVTDSKVSNAEMYKSLLVFTSDPKEPLSQEEAWRRSPIVDECSALLKQARPFVFFRFWLRALWMFGGGLLFDKARVVFKK